MRHLLVPGKEETGAALYWNMSKYMNTVKGKKWIHVILNGLKSCLFFRCWLCFFKMILHCFDNAEIWALGRICNSISAVFHLFLVQFLINLTQLSLFSLFPFLQSYFLKASQPDKVFSVDRFSFFSNHPVGKKILFYSSPILPCLAFVFLRLKKSFLATGCWCESAWRIGSLLSCPLCVDTPWFISWVRSLFYAWLG